MENVKAVKTAKKLKPVEIGHVGVESGQLLIIDPSHASNPRLGDIAAAANILELGAEIQTEAEVGSFASAVTLNRFGGDGYYAVFADYEGGEIVQLRVDL